MTTRVRCVRIDLKLYARLLNVEPGQAPTFDSWAECWLAIAAVLGSQRHILILDEFTYAVESDPAMLSSLQHSWDQAFKETEVVLVLCGSHIHTMETLQTHQSPLFGRLTGQWRLLPLPFSTLDEFLPGWTIEERVAAYAVVGGVPAYLEWLNPERSLTNNIRDVVLAPGSMFVAEPAFLLYDIYLTARCFFRREVFFSPQPCSPVISTGIPRSHTGQFAFLVALCYNHHIC